MVVRRVVRYLGLDRNPLRRTVDRLDAWLTIAFMATLLLVGPVLAMAVGTAITHHRLAEARAAQRHAFPTRAVLEESASYPVTSEYATTPVQTRVKARWTGPDGRIHHGEIEPDSTGPVGTVVTLWTDAAGNPVAAPPRTDMADADGLAGGMLALVGFAGLVLGGWVPVRRALDRRRMASWDVQWRTVEPRWSGRR
jgi:hypothetical protein